MNHDPNQKTGKWMLAIGWICALGLLTLYFDDFLAEKFNPNQQPQSSVSRDYIEVQLKQNRQGHYVASGTINGVAVTFLLDTGATEVSIPAHLQEKLQLQAGYSATVSTANGNIRVYDTQIPVLTLGNITLHNVDAHLNPGFRSDEILLGMSVLRQLDFEQRDRTLLLKQPRPYDSTTTY
ncbi:TIGR02281 family clan AA aspartic protease [Bowmanella sp. JS7-9]|uniref:TIGR02281 family clan AA aspartic protease n=1 Tax=Pseudobowmanella zhangzhouensis TaxID=1537679 RepID=A0ABW1XMV7_9ALTE|nr:TIGR02281 family clan AA aspartic protease [Bowmanella sp. JS7-9]TBX21971.1 aspartyl protease [Bowmanella sp. JS7-9]